MKPNIDLPVAFFDFVIEYNADPENAIDDLSILMLDPATCEARQLFLKQIELSNKKSTGGFPEHSAGMPSARLKQVVKIVVTDGPALAITSKSVSIDEMGALTWNRTALKEVHEGFTSPDIRSDLPKPMAPQFRRLRWVATVAALLLVGFFMWHYSSPFYQPSSGFEELLADAKPVATRDLGPSSSDKVRKIGDSEFQTNGAYYIAFESPRDGVLTLVFLDREQHKITVLPHPGQRRTIVAANASSAFGPVGYEINGSVLVVVTKTDAAKLIHDFPPPPETLKEFSDVKKHVESVLIRNGHKWAAFDEFTIHPIKE